MPLFFYYFSHFCVAFTIKSLICHMFVDTGKVRSFPSFRLFGFTLIIIGLLACIIPVSKQTHPLLQVWSYNRMIDYLTHSALCIQGDSLKIYNGTQIVFRNIKDKNLIVKKNIPKMFPLRKR